MKKEPIDMNWSKNAYYQEIFTKNLLVLHHTDGRANARASADYLQDQSVRMRLVGDSKGRKYSVAVPWWVDRNGDIYRAFDDRCWGHHNGTGAFNAKRSVSIELENLGVFFEKNGRLFNRYGEPVNESRYRVYRHYEPWRGSQFFEVYYEKQAEALIELIDDILTRHPNIPRQIPRSFFPDAPLPYSSLAKFKGILTHAHSSGAFPLRYAKFDLSVAYNAHIERLCRELSLKKIDL